MFSNINKSSRTNNNRSNTLSHNNSSKNNRNSQSHSKQNVNSNNSSNNIPKPILTPIIQQNFVDKPYYLGRGNNHQLIKRILSRRKGWGEVFQNQFALFKWLQNSSLFKFHTLGKECICFNHFQYHRQLSNKQRLVQNLVNFCQANKLNAYSFIPVTYILDLTTGEQDLALHSFLKFYNRMYPGQINNNNSSRKYQTVILPRNKYNPYLSAQQLNKRSQGNFYCKPYCPKTFIDEQSKAYLWILKPTFLNRGRGVVLFKQLQELQKIIWRYYEGEGLEDYGQKYQIPQKIESLPESQQKKLRFEQQIVQGQEQQTLKNEQKIQLQQVQKKQTQQKQKYSEEKNNKNQQKQQQVTLKRQSVGNIGSSSNNTTQNANLINNNQSKISHARCLSFVIQKYIQKPMLIQGKKFDIRVWALLNQNLQVFVFQQGYLRFSSQPYSTKNNHMNPFIHLTNNSVQKYCNQYDKTSGNQFALSQLVNHIPQSKSASIYTSIRSKIKQIIWLSMCSVRRKININSRKECFQLFGYDFMIDKDYKVWLIQVNTNPAIDQSGVLLKNLLPRMIDDMFKLTIDKIFTSKVKQDQEQLSVDGYENGHNMWQYVGDLRQGANDRNNGRRLTFARR